ncbi:MAG TPA: aquaporin [Vicinamibacterales bacterium]|nr:aquaporin [Vicinamibacterales bacterium]
MRLAVALTFTVFAASVAAQQAYPPGDNSQRWDPVAAAAYLDARMDLWFANGTISAGLVTEIVMTFMFLLIIVGATDARAPQGLAPTAIGLGLTLIHLISIPVTQTSVNPATSTGTSLVVGGWALSQLWLFWVAPGLGAALAGGVCRWLGAADRSRRTSVAPTPVSSV